MGRKHQRLTEQEKKRIEELKKKKEDKLELLRSSYDLNYTINKFFKQVQDSIQ